MKKRANADSTSTGADEGWAVLTTLIGGFTLWGGLGFVLDRWWGTAFLTPTGLIVGMALGIYAVVARHGGFKPVRPTTQGYGLQRPAEYNPGLYSSRTRSPAPDARPGPPPANTRRETECL